jgi:hypothetical protein
VADSTGLGEDDFKGLLTRLLELIGSEIEVVVSGSDLDPPLTLELSGELGRGQELGDTDRIGLEIGREGTLVLDRSTIERWWTEGDVVHVEAHGLRLAIAPAAR